MSQGNRYCRSCNGQSLIDLITGESPAEWLRRLEAEDKKRLMPLDVARSYRTLMGWVFGETVPPRFHTSKGNRQAIESAEAYCREHGIPPAKWVAIQMMTIYRRVVDREIPKFYPSMVRPNDEAVARYEEKTARQARKYCGADDDYPWFDMGILSRFRSRMDHTEHFVAEVLALTPDPAARRSRVVEESALPREWLTLDAEAEGRDPPQSQRVRQLIKLCGKDMVRHAKLRASARAFLTLCMRRAIDVEALELPPRFSWGAWLLVLPAQSDTVALRGDAPSRVNSGMVWRPD